jgi:hypothetical protein
MTFKGNDLSKVVNESYFSTYNSGEKKTEGVTSSPGLPYSWRQLSLYALDISGVQRDKTRQTETIKPTHKGDRGHTSSCKSRHTFHFSI